ncbi:hypothetical protein [Synechococcus sp. CB0205]|uniref:hypothetical protein n=1 Tax=Synechococcus sp. CB0205 TaxID=232363 RepID=UPI0012EA5B2B|nr:hypothetical protein [Synechococcus sp. CB0205]
MSTKITLSKLIAPVDSDGSPDQRLSSSLNRILAELGDETAQELLKFATETAVLQRNAASAGLRLAIAVFNEARYLEKYHRFDEDNQYGWRSRRLRKQVQQMVEAVGFKRNNAHKLVATADWLTSRHTDKDEQKWFETLTPSHIYELSRMSSEGFAAVKQEVSYTDFRFSAGQLPISVKRLEELRQEHPKSKEMLEGEKTNQDSTARQVAALKAADDADEMTTGELLQQFIYLAQIIDWSSIQQDPLAMESLNSIEYTLSHISEALDQWKYASHIYA